MAAAPLVVCGSPGESLDGLLEALASRGWEPVRASVGRDGREQASAPAHAPGLLSLLEPERLDVSALEGLLDSSGREWVALASAQAGDSEVLASPTITRSLFACHRLPADAAAVDTLLQHAATMAELRAVPAPGPAPARGAGGGDDIEMVGTTPAMLNLFAQIRKTASVDAPVLIRGESGTGKELAAYSVYERSARADGPFVAVNCGALPPELIQSELFGHEKGAFTGAVSHHEGRIEAAHGGTLFLDEIGDLSLPLQANLLRFLQSGVIQRVGSTREKAVDVRVIAATQVCLEDAVAAGEFREDLYYRLNVLPLDIPPLRDRPDDIEVMARFFFERFAAERAPGLAGISCKAMQVMRQHDWPGNVRELLNRMRRGVVMAGGRMLQPEDLGLERRTGWRRHCSLQEAREHSEREAVRAALIRNGRHVANAARDLQVSRMTLYRLLDKHGLRRPEHG